jgi:hypothetical protein
MPFTTAGAGFTPPEKQGWVYAGTGCPVKIAAGLTSTAKRPNVNPVFRTIAARPRHTEKVE